MKLNKRDIHIIRILACVILLSYLCNRQLAAGTKEQVTKLQSVEVFDANGKTLGRLEESKKRDCLFFIPPGKEAVKFGEYEDDVKQRLAAPGDGAKAAVYIRNCGATTDFATRLDIVTDNNAVGKDDNNTVFITKGYQPINVKWQGKNIIVVNCPRIKQERIYKRQNKYGNIKIEYHETDQNSLETKYVEYANFNYGLTGISAGIAEEILLRIAGWAQEKSGLARKEWGHWYGQPPYGDDPNEQNLIKQGVEWTKINADKK
jgi:hypothetical protein